MIGDCHLFRKTWSLADRKHEEKERRGRSGEIDEKISREENTLDWSQSKVFLVLSLYLKLSLTEIC